MKRHMTVTAFVSREGCTLLHWHAKNRMWLPPGGHIEPEEDPIQALCREAEEETGLAIEVLPSSDSFPYEEPEQLPAPVTIMVEDIPATPEEPAHQHIDLVYFARPDKSASNTFLSEGWRWVSEQELQSNTALNTENGAAPVPAPEDVRVLGLAAIRAAREECRDA